MIEHPHCVTVDEAARDLECTLRTIWRDPNVLQQVGFPAESIDETFGQELRRKFPESATLPPSPPKVRLIKRAPGPERG